MAYRNDFVVVDPIAFQLVAALTITQSIVIKFCTYVVRGPEKGIRCKASGFRGDSVTNTLTGEPQMMVHQGLVLAYKGNSKDQ